MDLGALLPPLLGQATSLFLFLSPLREVKRQRSAGTVTIDSIPFCVTLVQHILWIVFAGLLQDVWIFVPNFLGTFTTVFYTTTALRFCANDVVSRKMELLLCFGLGFAVLFVMFAMTPILVESVDLRKQICGNICIFISVAMYGSPSFEAIQAIRTKDTSNLSLPLAIAGALNAVFWGTYGLAIGVPAVMIPNFFGLVLSVFNILVKVCCRSNGSGSSSQAASLQPSLLLEALDEEHTVLIQSVVSDAQLHVPPVVEQICDSEAQLDDVQVGSAAEGIGVTIIRIPAGHSETSPNLAFRLSDGRYLCVRACHAQARCSQRQPSPFALVATSCTNPGEDGMFKAVPCGGWGLHHSESGMHEYDQDTVAFWNPMHKVFLRLNESGMFDCSPPIGHWNPVNQANEDKIQIPGGWYWERFKLQLADCNASSPAAAAAADVRVLGQQSPV